MPFIEMISKVDSEAEDRHDVSDEMFATDSLEFKRKTFVMEILSGLDKVFLVCLRVSLSRCLYIGCWR